MSKPQPYTAGDLAVGEAIVRELRGLRGFDDWAEHIAKALARERDLLRRSDAAYAICCSEPTNLAHEKSPREQGGSSA